MHYINLSRSKTQPWNCGLCYDDVGWHKILHNFTYKSNTHACEHTPTDKENKRKLVSNTRRYSIQYTASEYLFIITIVVLVSITATVSLCACNAFIKYCSAFELTFTRFSPFNIAFHRCSCRWCIKFFFMLFSWSHNSAIAFVLNVYSMVFDHNMPVWLNSLSFTLGMRPPVLVLFIIGSSCTSKSVIYLFVVLILIYFLHSLSFYLSIRFFPHSSHVHTVDLNLKSDPALKRLFYIVYIVLSFA